MITALGVFLAVLVADWLWARYTIAAAARLQVPAAGFSALIVLAGGVTTVALTHSAWYLIPAALGAFVGTWLAVR